MKSILAAIALVAIACGGGAYGDAGAVAPSGPATISGWWDLKTINGVALPAPTDPPPAAIVKSSELLFNAGLVYNNTVYSNVQVTNGQGSSLPFTQNGNQISMGDRAPAVVSGTTLTRYPTGSSYAWVYAQR